MFGRRAFSVAGSTAWNLLPDSLRDPARSPESGLLSVGSQNFYSHLTSVHSELEAYSDYCDI